MDVQIKPLLKLSAIDAAPKFLQSLQDSGKFVKKLRESDPDVVNSTANRSGSEEEHRALQAGLLYLALTEPDRRRSFCTDIVLTSRDNLTYVLSEITRLVAETWTKMSQNVRVNLLSLLNELIATRASVEVLMLHLYRRMTNGDLTQGNLWLIENIVDILEKNKEWLCGTDRQSFLLPLTVFTLLRLIPDHFTSAGIQPCTQMSPANSLQSSLASLRLREIALSEDLIRKHFDRCALGGRDFVRLLHGVARLEPMRRLWEDLFHNFPSFTSHYSGISDVLEICTPQYLTQTLIPHEVEQWTRWMLKNVHCVPRVPVNRYQEFFQKKFFSTPESQSLRVCLIRYIVTYFYPDNEMLASTLIPRWNMISWILSQSTCAVVTANAKLALFYDWLFFKPNDCIMNLEPALLAMMNHLTPRTQPIALTLVDFMVKISGAYHPPVAERIIVGIRSGLEEMIRLGVIKNIAPLLDMLHRVSPELLRSLRTLLGLEPVLTVQPPLVGETISRVVSGEKSDEDTPISTATVTPVTPRRPSTPPLGGSKLKLPGSDGVSLLDPRLTRGHAAVLAGAVPACVVPLQADTNINRPLPTNLPSVIGQQQQQASVTLPSLPFIEDSGTKTNNITKRDVLSLSISTSLNNKVTLPSPPDSLLSRLDLDKLDMDDTRDMDLRSSRADWSPPPLPPSQTANHHKNDMLPETPESMELTIDNLRRRFQEYHIRYHYSVEPADVNTLVEQLDGPVRAALEQFRDLAIRTELVRNIGGILCADRIGADDSEELHFLNGHAEQRSYSVRLRSAPVLGDLCDAMEALVQAVLMEDSFDDLEMAGRTAAVVCELLFPLFAERLMPAGTEWSEEQLEDCLAFPIFVPLRHLWQMNPGDPKRELLLLLLTEMQARQPRLGYHLLFFLKVGKLNDESLTTYRSFCASQENPNLRNSLYRDMQLLADDNRRLFAYLLPDVYTGFASELIDDVEFLHLVVSTVDPTMCNTLICEIVRGHLNMFQSNDLSSVLKASLSWNSIEQFFFWQLINAHEIPTRSFLPLMKYVDPAKHPEACSNLILLLKLEKPSFELVRALLARLGSNDSLSVTALHFWSCPDNQHSARFASILKSMIMTSLSPRVNSVSNSGSGSATREARDKKRNGPKPQYSSDNYVDLSLILTHLDAIRRNCRNISLLQDEDIQLALQEVVKSNHVALSVKDHFSDLLALAEVQPTSPQSVRLISKSTDPQEPTDLMHGLDSGSVILQDSKMGKYANRPAALGSKGGHRLRNLDSRRAAEAERRQLPLPTGGKRTSRVLNNQTNHDGDDSDNNEDPEAVSLTSSSNSSEDEDKRPVAVTGRKKRGSRNSSPVRITQMDPSSAKPSKRLPESPAKDRRASTKRSLLGFGPSSNVLKSDDEDDDDEEKGLEVVVLEDDSGDEKTDDRIRPPKRRKMSGRRSILDD